MSPLQVRFNSAFRLTMMLSAGALATADSTSNGWAVGYLCLALVAAGCIGSKRRVERLGRPWPQTAITLLVLAVTMAALADYSRVGSPLILALGHYMAAVMAVRLMERRRARDNGQMLVLSGLVVVIAAVVSYSVVLAPFLLAYLAAGGYSLMLLQICRDAERRADLAAGAGLPLGPAGGAPAAWPPASPPPAEAAPTLPPVPIPAPPRRPPLLRTALATMAVVLSVGSAVAAVMPRGFGGFLGDWHARPNQRMTGFDETVDFSKSGRMDTDESVVMHLKLSDPETGRAVRLGEDRLLLRGATQEDFNGATWTSWSNPHRRQFVRKASKGEEIMQGLRTAATGPLVRQEITLYNASGPNLFALYMPVRVDLAPGGLALDRLDLTLRSADQNLRGTHRYVVDSAVTPLQAGLVAEAARAAQPVAGNEGPRYAAGYTGGHGGFFEGRGRRRLRPSRSGRGEMPSEAEARHRADEARLDALARDILAGARLTAADRVERKAAAIERWLRTEFRYSQDTPEEYGTSNRPILDFLFERRVGNCQFFASAMVLLCRTKSVDAAARLVTGFKGGEYNDAGGFYIIRGKDAHAWVEVWTGDPGDSRPADAPGGSDGGGWRPFDPTPAGDTATDNTGLWHSAKQFFELLDYRWGETVLSYSKSQRDALAGAVGAWVAENGLRRLGVLEWSIFQDRASGGPGLRLGRAEPTTVGALALVLVGAGLWMLLKRDPATGPGGSLSRGRRAAGGGGPAAGAEPPPRFYDELVAALETRGVMKLPAATPRAFAAALASADGKAYGELPRLVGMLYQVRYADRPLTHEQQAELGAALERLRSGN